MTSQSMKTMDMPANTARIMGLSRSGIAELGRWATHYSLALIFLWFGALKFTAYEASAIAPLVMNSPFVMWWHGALGIDGTSRMLGGYEIITAFLLAARPFAPRLSAIGGAMAALVFAITVSFIFTTPGVVQPGAGGPLALSPMPGQFLLKDIVLFSVSLWILGASLTESAMKRAMV